MRGLGKGEDADDMWLKMTTCVRKVASEVFGVSRGGKQEGKDTWWWNGEVQRAIKEKECFKRHGFYGGKARRGDSPPSRRLGEYGVRRGDAIRYPNLP